MAKDRADKASEVRDESGQAAEVQPEDDAGELEVQGAFDKAQELGYFGDPGDVPGAGEDLTAPGAESDVAEAEKKESK